MSRSAARRLDRDMREHHEQARSAMASMHGPSVVDRPVLYLDPAEAFRRRAERWTEETLPISSVSERLEHPDCQAILAMGAQAIPLALAALERSPLRWAPVLMELTGEQPVSEEGMGQSQFVRTAWLAWGARHGLKR